MPRSYPLRVAAYLSGIATYRTLSLTDDMTNPDILAGRQLGHLLTGYRHHPDPAAMLPLRPVRDFVVVQPVYCDDLTVWPRKARTDCPRCHGAGLIYDQDDPYTALADCPCAEPLLRVPAPQWLRSYCHRLRHGRPTCRPASYSMRLHALAAGARTFRKPEAYHFADPQSDPTPRSPLRHYRLMHWSHAQALVIATRQGHPSCVACDGRGFVADNHRGKAGREENSFARDSAPCLCAEPLLRIPLPLKDRPFSVRRGRGRTPIPTPFDDEPPF